MKRKWKIIIGVILVIVVVGVMAFERSKGLEAKMIEVQPRSIAKTFEEEGKVIAAEEYPIYAVYGGKVAELPVREGQNVQKGDLLLTFNTNELLFQVGQMQGQLKSIQAQQELEKTKIAPEKIKALYEAGAISQKEYEDAMNTVNSQYYTGQVEALQAQIDLLQYRINESHIFAPADGIVAGLDVKKGMVVNPGVQVMTLYPKENYQVEVYVLTEDAAQITPGMQVKLTQKNKDKDIIFEGTVERIAPAAVEKISALGLIQQRLKITINPQTPPDLVLRPGYALDVEFTTHRQEQRLVVPKTVLFPYQGKDALWVAQNGKAVVKTVEKGFENEKEVVIEKGLNPGDLVLLNPQLEGIKEGKKIKRI